jgi:hypothetical protein
VYASPKREAWDGETVNGYGAKDHEGDYGLYRIRHQLGLLAVLWMLLNKSGSKRRDEDGAWFPRAINEREKIE